MKKLLLILSMFALSITGCVTAIPLALLGVGSLNENETEKKWLAQKSMTEFQFEKSLFKSRLSNKTPCWDKGIFTFTTSGESPNKECLYPSGSYSKNDQGKIAQTANVLTVVQTTPAGFLVKSTYTKCDGNYCRKTTGDNYIFIYKTTENGLVDGSLIDEGFNWDLYEYTGPFSYKTILGSKTIRSFKKIKISDVLNAESDLKYFNTYIELYAELKIWSAVKEIWGTQEKKLEQAASATPP